MASPMRYLREPHGMNSSPSSNAFVRYSEMSLRLTRKSDSLNEYRTFHPILPYFLRSSTTACKKASTKRHGRKAQCGHSSNVAWSTFAYVARMFSLSPSGGSVVTFSAFCKMPSGKAGLGMVVSQRRKSSCGFFICSRIFSKRLSHEVRRWQFWSSTQSPFLEPVSSMPSATGPCPCPRAHSLSFGPVKPSSSPSIWMSDPGSAPGLKMNTRGMMGVDWL
mmetsp:Transcript_68319/g.134107  ORF Transcript_68319/g.134107 Transcript_68319/m.134107 type:complete len:220 (+) Transcript_68319:1348-2007(+)